MARRAAPSSEQPKFYARGLAERLRVVSQFARLTAAERRVLKDALGSRTRALDALIENVVGAVPIPLGIATYFRVNGRDVLVPMAIEEPSVVAAASHAAKVARAAGGFTASADEPVMIGQVALVGVPDLEAAEREVRKSKARILRAAEPPDSQLAKIGAGAKDLETRRVALARGEALVVHLLVDVRDAMGANAVDTRCERAAPLLEELTGGVARLRILSNLADRRLARASAVFPADEVGVGTVDAILDAQALADADPYRAATHNKGALNGIDAVALATGNDWRAVEAGAHAYAARSGRYRGLTTWKRNARGDLEGAIELPLALGIRGGATEMPVAKVALKILGVRTARELCSVAAAVGLAQNFAALRALVTEGIQKGHMRLHERLPRGARARIRRR